MKTASPDSSCIRYVPNPSESAPPALPAEARSSELEVPSSEFKVQGSASQLPAPPALAPVLLRDGRPGLRALVQIEAREPVLDRIENPNSKIKNTTPPAVLDFIASDDTLDRYGESLVPAGWRLDNYRRNPVFQNAHQYGDIIFTLGKALVTEVREVAGHDGRVRPALYQRIEFAVEANPLARIAYALYQGKFLNAVSVGFIPLRWEDGESAVGRVVLNAPKKAPEVCHEINCSPVAVPSRLIEDNQPCFGYGAIRDGAGDLRASHSPGRTSNCRRRYLEMELLEVSAVGIPANPAALQLGLEAGSIAKADVRDVLELLRALFDSKLKAQPSASSSQRFRSNPAGVTTNTSALGVNANEAQLLRLARVLRELLRCA